MFCREIYIYNNNEIIRLIWFHSFHVSCLRSGFGMFQQCDLYLKWVSLTVGPHPLIKDSLSMSSPIVFLSLTFSASNTNTVFVSQCLACLPDKSIDVDWTDLLMFCVVPQLQSSLSEIPWDECHSLTHVSYSSGTMELGEMTGLAIQRESCIVKLLRQTLHRICYCEHFTLSWLLSHTV